jgi:hypothetical protein
MKELSFHKARILRVHSRSSYVLAWEFWLRHFFCGIAAFAVATGSHAVAQSPPPNDGETNVLCRWSFYETNSLMSDLGYAARGFTNVTCAEMGALSSGYAVWIASTNPASLNYRLIEEDSTINLSLDYGSFCCWMAPSWSGTNRNGTGPGNRGAIIAVGAPGEAGGYWELSVDTSGCRLVFASGDGQSEQTYFTAPIAWSSNEWHYISLCFSATNSSLYLDGAFATNGPGVAYLPSSQTLAEGFYIGSEGPNPTNQARAGFDSLATFGRPLAATAVADQYWLDYANFILNPNNLPSTPAPFPDSAPSYVTNSPVLRAVAGPGYMQFLGYSTNWISSSAVWITNVSAKLTTNGLTRMGFEIGGGQASGALYDAFGSGALAGSHLTNSAWSWLGNVLAAGRYQISTELSNSTAFFILGSPQDSFNCGLTDAYQWLVMRVDPAVAAQNPNGLTVLQEFLLHSSPAYPKAWDSNGLINLEVFTPSSR